MNKLGKILVIVLVISLLAVLLVGCGGGLTLTVKEPVDGATVTTASVTVKGNVSMIKATVTVNDVKATLTGQTGYFTSGVKLVEGENPIKVVATLGKQVITKTITVTYTPSK